MLGDPLTVVALLGKTFRDLRIEYAVVGSLATSMYGIPRATQDVDLVAAIAPGDAARVARALAGALEGEFHADEDAIREAIEAGGAFNVIHLATMFKADIFLAHSDEWSRNQIARSRLQEIPTTSGTVEFRVASPEDVILHKLRWYRLGDETSERQWNDVLGVMRIQGSALNDDYLDKFASVLGVADLISRARAQV